MKMRYIKIIGNQITIYCILLIFISCSNIKDVDIKGQIMINEAALTKAINEDAVLYENETKIYASSFLALFEVYDIDKANKTSINNKIAGFDTIPKPVKKINSVLAGFNAYYNILNAYEIKKADIKLLHNNLNKYYEEKLDKDIFQNSIHYSKIVSDIIIKNFKNNDGFYFIKNLDELNINRPETILKTTQDELLKNANEIYQASQQLTDLQKNTCNYWNGDDQSLKNKISISGHWFRLLSQIIKDKEMDANETLKLYATLGNTINESNKIGSQTGYTLSYISPKTFINKNKDSKWSPYLKSNKEEYNSITKIYVMKNETTNNEEYYMVYNTDKTRYYLYKDEPKKWSPEITTKRDTNKLLTHINLDPECLIMTLKGTERQFCKEDDKNAVSGGDIKFYKRGRQHGSYNASMNNGTGNHIFLELEIYSKKIGKELGMTVNKLIKLDKENKLCNVIKATIGHLQSKHAYDAGNNTAVNKYNIIKDTGLNISHVKIPTKLQEKLDIEAEKKRLNYLLPNFNLPFVGKNPVSPNCSSIRIS